MVKIKDGFKGERTMVVPRYITNRYETIPLLSALGITDIGYYPHAGYHYIDRREPIDQYVFIYCVDGSGSYCIGQVNENLNELPRIKVHKDQYFILPAGLPHQYSSDEDTPWTIYWIHFRGTLASSYANEAMSPQDIRTTKYSRIATRNELFEEIFNTISSGFSVESLCYASSLFHHYLGSMRFLREYRASSIELPNSDNITEAAIHYMKENIEKHLILEDIAHYIGFSASYFSKRFHDDTGHSPLSYFNLLKIQRACQLLDNTDMKINQISFKLGFDDTFYFSRIFTKLMDVSPREYRKQKKG